MLKRRYRLKTKKAFDATYKNRNILSNSLLTIYLGKESKDSSSYARFGFVVSKKFHKRAVKRNRIRRLMREVCRLAIKNGNLGNFNKYMSCVIIPKSSALGANFSDIEKSFYSLVERLK